MTEARAPGERGQSAKPVAKAGKPAPVPGAKPAAAANGSPALAIAFDPWERSSQIAVIGLFVIALLWAAYVAQPVIVPVVLAWVIATIVLPIVTWLRERNVPRASPSSSSRWRWSH